jgi:hypothetical protein
MSPLDILGGGSQLDPSHEILRAVVDPLPAPVERAWVALDRLQQLVVHLQRHPPGTGIAEQKLRRDLLETALSEDEPQWPSADGLLAARRAIEAHKELELAAHGARTGAENHLAKTIVACEKTLCERLDDLLGNLQHETGIRRAAHDVPLGVDGDTLVRTGGDVAKQAWKLSEAAARFDQIRAARHVIFETGARPKTAACMDVVAEGMEDGLTWKSQYVHLRSGREPEPWANGVGGELHYAVLKGIRLRVWTAEQLDQAGYTPAGMIVMQPARI